MVDTGLYPNIFASRYLPLLFFSWRDSWWLRSIMSHTPNLQVDVAPRRAIQSSQDMHPLLINMVELAEVSFNPASLSWHWPPSPSPWHLSLWLLFRALVCTLHNVWICSHQPKPNPLNSSFLHLLSVVVHNQAQFGPSGPRTEIDGGNF